MRLVSRTEEEHARLMLSDELGVEFRLYDDGSEPNMPDLLAADGKHVAEVITTTPSAIREAEQRLALKRPGFRGDPFSWLRLLP